MAESFGERLGRRLALGLRHPFAWARYVWIREIRPREVRFAEHPRFLDWGPSYRVARRALESLSGASPEALDGYFAELAPLHRDLLRTVGRLPSAGALMQAPLLYVLVRAARPRWLIETGISSGMSTRLLLEALRRNGGGHLDSIGLGRLALRAETRAADVGLGDRSVGWLVPDGFDDLWTVHLGRSVDVLPSLLDAHEGPLDLFLHDSLHEYATMQAEYALAAGRLRPGGLLLSDDVHANRAWPDFLAERRLSGAVELDHDVGAVVWPDPNGTSPRPGSG